MNCFGRCILAEVVTLCCEAALVLVTAIVLAVVEYIFQKRYNELHY